MYFPSTGSEFGRSNADAHRVRPTDFHAPALISHQGFWIEIPRQVERRKIRNDIKHKLDYLILRLASRIKSSCDRDVYISPVVDNENILFANVSFSCCFLKAPQHLGQSGNLDVKTLTAMQRNVFEGDQRVISLHFKWNECEIATRFELHTEYFTISTFAELKSCSNADLCQRIAQVAEGNITSDVALTKEVLFDHFWKDLADDTCKGLLTDPMFSHVFADFRGIVITNETLLKNATSTTLDRYLPFLIPLWCERPSYECSVSYMLGSRTLYMTSLGPQIPEKPRPRGTAARTPVTYLLCAGQATNKTERGKLIDLIHAAGVSRLAALRDLAALRIAGGALAGLDHFTTAARGAVIDEQDVTQAIRAAQSHFNSITTDFNAETKADYGILYRIERSRYYVARFKESASQMRIQRVNGYHKYDEFVRQRLGGAFDFIHSLGNRYERAVNALALLDGFYLTVKSNEIASAQQASEREGERITDSILNIQEYGEFTLIAALVPYYVMGLFSHLLGEAGANREDLVFLTYVVWSAAFGLAMYRRMKMLQRRAKSAGSTVSTVKPSIIRHFLCWSVWALLLMLGLDVTLPLLINWLKEMFSLIGQSVLSHFSGHA